MEAGLSASGSMPTCSRRAKRREDALASTKSFCALDWTAAEGARWSSDFHGASSRQPT